MGRPGRESNPEIPRSQGESAIQAQDAGSKVSRGCVKATPGLQWDQSGRVNHPARRVLRGPSRASGTEAVVPKRRVGVAAGTFGDSGLPGRSIPFVRSSWRCIVPLFVLLASLALSSCSAPIGYGGTVTGRLLLRSGAPGAPDQPIPGTVIIGTPTIGHYGEWIPVNSSGMFKSFVLIGTYPIVGHSPLFGNGKLNCNASPRTVTIKKGSKVMRDVICTSGPSS